jgi:iron complex transport system substrate-binding protein
LRCIRLFGIVLFLFLASGFPGAAQSPEWARFFRIEDLPDSRTVVVGNTTLGVPEERYVLDQDISLPVRRAVILSSSYAPAFEALGSFDAVAAISRGHWFYSREVHARLDDGTLRAVGSGNSIDLEAIVALAADLVIAYPDALPPTARRRLERQFDIPVIYSWDYLEEHPLGRAEWVLLVGELLEKGALADELFAAVQRDYLEIAERASAATGPRRGARTETAPAVLLNAPLGDVWPVPRRGSHAVQFIRDAGGTPVLSSEGIGVALLDPEVVLREATEADIWLNPGSAVSLANLRQTVRFAPGIPAFRSGRVYGPIRRISPEGAWDIFESGYLYPNRVLRDLVSILHPEILPNRELHYYRRLE